MAEKRFFRELSETESALSMKGTEIIVDSHTGVQYLYAWWGNTGGLAVLVDRDGRPLVSEDERVWR